MKLLRTIPLILLLGGCLSLDGIVSSGAATAGAVAGTALVNPGVGALLGIGAGLGADALTPDPAPPLQEINNIWQLLAYAWYNFTQHIVAIGALGGLLLLASMWFGIRMPRGEEKMLQKMMEKK